MKSGEPNKFTLKVMDVIRKIPRGKVATYKQVAGLAGKPHASRGVAWILNSCSEKYKLPWHRVLSSKGRIAFPPLTHNFIMQQKLLKREGVPSLGNGGIDMVRFQWKKQKRQRFPRNQPRMFS